jgi:hypothetical protein
MENKAKLEHDRICRTAYEVSRRAVYGFDVKRHAVHYLWTMITRSIIVQGTAYFMSCIISCENSFTVRALASKTDLH